MDNERWSNRILHRHQLNPVKTKLAQHVVIEVPNLNHGAVALNVVAVGVERLPEVAAGVGEHGGLSLASNYLIQ